MGVWKHAEHGKCDADNEVLGLLVVFEGLSSQACVQLVWAGDCGKALKPYWLPVAKSKFLFSKQKPAKGRSEGISHTLVCYWVGEFGADVVT